MLSTYFVANEAEYRKGKSDVAKSPPSKTLRTGNWLSKTASVSTMSSISLQSSRSEQCSERLMKATDLFRRSHIMSEVLENRRNYPTCSKISSSQDHSPPNELCLMTYWKRDYLPFFISLTSDNEVSRKDMLNYDKNSELI